MTKNRCGWVSADPLYVAYHDEEWGVPVGLGSLAAKSPAKTSRQPKSHFSSLNLSNDRSRSDKKTFEITEDAPAETLSASETSLADKKHFEFLTLESAQAGLSWLTILKRREGYRRVFHQFDALQVSKMTETQIERALQDTGIIRNRLKVNSAVQNAKVFLDIQRQFGSFDNYIWGFVDDKPINNHPKALSDIPATSEISDKVSRDLKARGMKFVGSTIIYAHLQATGIINDHTTDCFRATI